MLGSDVVVLIMSDVDGDVMADCRVAALTDVGAVDLPEPIHNSSVRRIKDSSIVS